LAFEVVAPFAFPPNLFGFLCACNGAGKLRMYTRPFVNSCAINPDLVRDLNLALTLASKGHNGFAMFGVILAGATTRHGYTLLLIQTMGAAIMTTTAIHVAMR